MRTKFRNIVRLLYEFSTNTSNIIAVKRLLRKKKSGGQVDLVHLLNFILCKSKFALYIMYQRIDRLFGNQQMTAAGDQNDDTHLLSKEHVNNISDFSSKEYTILNDSLACITSLGQSILT